MLDDLLAHLCTAHHDLVIQMAKSLDPEDACRTPATGRPSGPDRRGAGSGRAVGGQGHAGITPA